MQVLVLKMLTRMALKGGRSDEVDVDWSEGYDIILKILKKINCRNGLGLLTKVGWLFFVFSFPWVFFPLFILCFILYFILIHFSFFQANF